MKKQMHFLAGVLCGAIMFGGVTAAAMELVVKPTWQPIYVDGEQVSMTAYNINGNNYVKLRDIGQKVGFNVYWNSGVRIESQSAYTGEAPAEGTPQKPAAQENTDHAETIDLDQIRHEMVEQINALRREKGAGDLRVNESLMDAAQECAEKHFTNHNNQIECETVLKHGYQHGFGSNLTTLGYSLGTDIATRAVNSWRYSPGHYETMMAEDCDCIGVGVAVTEKKVYCYMFAGCPSANNPYA